MFAFVVCTFVAGAGIFFVAPKLANLSPEAQGEAVGYILGTFFIPWLVFGFSWRSFNKKKAEPQES